GALGSRRTDRRDVPISLPGSRHRRESYTGRNITPPHSADWHTPDRYARRLIYDRQPHRSGRHGRPLSRPPGEARTPRGTESHPFGLRLAHAAAPLRTGGRVTWPIAASRHRAGL